MKSPRCAVLLVADRRLQADRLLGDLQHLPHLLERHAELLGQLLGRRLAADLVQHLARRAHQLVDRLDHVHRDADRARLIGDRAGDRLADPPRRIGAELVAAAVFELIDRLHQADVAFLDQVQELQAAVGVFLGDRDHQAQVRLDHLLLRPRAVALAAAHRHVDAAELADRQAGVVRHRGDLAAHVGDVGRVLGDEGLPALGRAASRPARPSSGRARGRGSSSGTPRAATLQPSAVRRSWPSSAVSRWLSCLSWVTSSSMRLLCSRTCSTFCTSSSRWRS